MSSNQPGSVSIEKNKKRSDFFKKNNFFNTTRKSSVERTLKDKFKSVLNDNSIENSRVESFDRVDGYEGFFTTQQLSNVDFSKFENHVFFDSAVSKVQYAYYKILNEFPYDKSEYDVKQFINSLDGFTRYIYDTRITKNTGFLNFNGDNEVFIKDKTGNILSDFNGDHKVGLFNVNKKKFCFEFWLKVNTANDANEFGTQLLFQKKDQNNNGISIFLDNFRLINNKKHCNINVTISNENSFCKGFTTILLGEFLHINLSSIIIKGKKSFKFYVNGERQKSTNIGSYSSNLELSEEYIKSDVFIGNGTSHAILRDNSLNITRTSGLKGIIDEFRFFTNTKNEKDILEEMHINIFSRKDLSVYFKFNEPVGSYLNNNIVLDASSNKVHGIIRNHNTSSYTEAEVSVFREKNDVVVPLKYENKDLSPVIFPNFSDTLTSQQELMEKASTYDDLNPNIIWKFFPKNIFIDSSDADNNLNIFVSKEEITIDKTAKKELLGVNQPANGILANVILIWARFFDNIKCYLDQITEILSIDYEDINDKEQSSLFINHAISQIGFDFKEVFPNLIEEKLDKKNLSFEKEFSQSSIRKIQNILWKRFLINSQDYLKSKGTKNSIKSVFNSFGLQSDLFVNIREYNSQNKINMSNSFKDKVVNIKAIDFFEDYTKNVSVVFDNNGEANNKILLKNKFYNDNNPHFDFSNDWCLEYFVKFDKKDLNVLQNKQSIFRADSIQQDNSVIPYLNLVFTRDKKTKKSGKLELFINETNQSSQVRVCTLHDVNLFEEKTVYINVNKKSLTDDCSEYVLSSVQSDFGSKNIAIKSNKATINITDKVVDLDKIEIVTGYSNIYSAQTQTSLNNLDYTTCYEGKILNFKLWSQNLSYKSILMHKTDFSNYGLDGSDITSIHDNLLVNVTLKESFSENPRDDIENNTFTLYNEVLKSNNITCNIKIPAQYAGESFIKSFDYIVLEQSPEIDYPENYNRININSLTDSDLSKDYALNLNSPSYETDPDFVDFEDVRLSIDFSTSKFINKEISKILLINDYFSKTLSSSSSLYDENYQGLHELRSVFYKKLESEVKIKSLYQVYKYFDSILEDLLRDAIPNRVHYHGFNFVIESNISERSKYQYKMSKNRIGLNDTSLNFDSYSKKFLSSEYWDNINNRSDLFETKNSSNTIYRKYWKR